MAKEDNRGATAVLKVAAKLVVGLALLALGVWFIWIWRFDVFIMIRGCLGVFAALLGIIFLVIAKE
ncbi:MAG: hypothetical protein JW869_05235 [Candidatus Omnitrophica bacterium]|nr:hypothetical protein [Candidatus Omnitrophota bacterium]